MTTLLSGFDSSVGLLAVGRGLAPPGAPGLSARARAQTNSFLASSKANTNALFSSTSSGAYLSIDDLQTLIKGLRSRVPDSQRAAEFRSSNLDENGDVKDTENSVAGEDRVKTAEEMLASLRRGSVVDNTV